MRLPSNPKLTTHERVHLVMRGHFRLCDKNGGHTIWYAIAENTMLYANSWLCFMKPDS